jgi:hypothetical protein
VSTKQPILKNLPEHDNLVGDLRQLMVEACIIDSHANIQKIPKIDLLTQKLVVYITRRDHKVFNHAYKLAKEGHHGEQTKTG